MTELVVTNKIINKFFAFAWENAKLIIGLFEYLI